MTQRNIVEVIRVIRYYGEESAVRTAIQKSLPLGVKDCVDYSITVAEHLNELSPLVELTEEEVEKAVQ